MPLTPESDPDTDEDEVDGDPVDELEEAEDDDTVDEGDDQIEMDSDEELGAH